MFVAKNQRGFFAILALLFVLLTTGGFAAYLWSEGVFESEDSQIAKLTAAIIPDSSVVYDRNGEKIGEYYNFYHVAIVYDKIPKPMVNALLAVEDRKFFEHQGVNFKSLGRAVLSVLTSGHMSQGGSTITMQLVKNYLLTREKKVSRKLRELILAYYVEKNLSKERILELYLNTMYLGHGAYGVGAASLVYFGKPVDQLEIHEYALLAGLYQAPSAYDPHKNREAALKRQRVVLDAMAAAGYLTAAEAKQWRSRPITFVPWVPLNETVAPFFVSWVRNLVEEKLGQDGSTLNDRGLKIYTTLDRKIQELANMAVRNASPNLQGLQDSLRLKRNDRVETALLAIDPLSGAVLAMNGGRDFRQSQYNRAVAARRSPGSSFKPVVYSLALEKNMGWQDFVYVSPVDVGGYRPKNHQGDDMTEVTLIKALARSMNTPVVTMAQKFGLHNVIDRAHALGVRADLKLEAGIAIGGFSATLADIARLYGTIAAEGKLFDTWAVAKITDREDHVLFDQSMTPQVPVQVLSNEVAQLLRSGLQSVLTIGTGSSISDLATVAAGKTGTSDDSRDNWFCGFTQNIAVVTWVGSDGNASLGQSAAGATLALPIWSEFVRGVIAGPLPATPFPTMDGLSAVTIDPDYGIPAAQGVTALFRKDHLPKASQAAQDIKTLQQDKSPYRELKLDE